MVVQGRIAPRVVFAFFSLALALAGGPAFAAREAPVPWHTISLRLAVDAEGRGTLPDDERVPAVLMDRLRAAIAHWQFDPARVKGRAVPGTTGLTFRLEVATVANGDEGIRMTGAWVTPVARRRGIPRYPLTAIRDRREGEVVMELKVSRWGQVSRVKVVEARGGKDFEQAAVEAAGQYVFVPDTVDGRKVGTKVRLPMIFRLNPEGTDTASAEEQQLAALSAVPSPDSIRLRTKVEPHEI